MHHTHRDQVRNPVAEQDRRHVGDHHPQRSASHHRDKRLILRRQRHRGDLRFVAHLGQKEGDQRGAEHAEAGEFGIVFLKLVGNQRPGGHGDEGHTQNPAQGVRCHQRGNPRTERAGHAVICQRCHQNAQHNRQGLTKLGGENEGEQLRFVADFGQRDDAG